MPVKVSGIGCTKTKQKIPTGAGIREKVVHVVCNPRPAETALDAINGASGRSLVTEERIPDHVLDREFSFGFALDLMRKDIGITMDTLTALNIPAPVLRQVNEMFAMGEAKLGPKAEHMEVVKILEELAGVTLKR